MCCTLYNFSPCLGLVRVHSELSNTLLNNMGDLFQHQSCVMLLYERNIVAVCINIRDSHISVCTDIFV